MIAFIDSPFLYDSIYCVLYEYHLFFHKKEKEFKTIILERNEKIETHVLSPTHKTFQETFIVTRVQ